MRTFPADEDCLGAALDFVRGVMREAGVASDTVIRVELASEEIFVNIALYAYRESESRGDITIRCAAGPEIVSLEFVDSGVPFNPLEREDPDVSLGIEERKPGGLGIFMAKKIMDAVEYRREDGKNFLHMSKRIT
ncbi:MAG: ATP-binding protein [Synergistaceae bacterium]|jgi:anti-sigma regulatory factor (Ser/Thr protein kinase)|nr:ATP-binding protein [Synergistaceae bacterium]